MELTIVVCGWHFKNGDIYRKLINEVKYYHKLAAKYYIASHKKPEEIDKSFLNAITRLGWNVLYFENEGWDWGAYQQFLIWQKDNDTLSDYYLFLHDDIKIKKHGFIKAFLEKIQDGVNVVGNSVSISGVRKYKMFFPEEVLWAEMKGFSIKSNEWDVVRGSCFFTTKDVVENILIEMHIRKGLDIVFANSSLRIFSGLVRDRFGDKSVGYIGDSPRSSIYIDEEHRGNRKMSLKERIKSLLHPYINRTLIKRILRFKKVAPVKSGMGLKINLGCGTQCLAGYFNVDIDSPYADQNADILQLEFDDNSVAEVLIVHVIEHIDYVKVEPLLKKIYSWLRLDGQLILEFPDLIKCCRLILKMKNKPEKIQHSPCGAQGLYGGNPKKSAYDIHKWGWTKTTMVPLLKKTGFRKVYVERPEYYVPKRDVRIVAVK